MYKMYLLYINTYKYICNFNALNLFFVLPKLTQSIIKFIELTHIAGSFSHRKIIYFETENI